MRHEGRSARDDEIENRLKSLDAEHRDRYLKTITNQVNKMHSSFERTTRLMTVALIMLFVMFLVSDWNAVANLTACGMG